MGREKYQIRTKRGYDFYTVASAMQKAIRRGDAKVAGYFAIELEQSNFAEYVWYRLLVISAEDCWGLITQEIEALYNSYEMGIKRGKKPRIFLAKAVLVLAMCKKCRDADHLTNFIYDNKLGGYEDILTAYDSEIKEPIPDYAYDVHTLVGKKMGKTKEMFFNEEFAGLEPRQNGLFDKLIK